MGSRSHPVQPAVQRMTARTEAQAVPRRRRARGTGGLQATPTGLLKAPRSGCGFDLVWLVAPLTFASSVVGSNPAA